MQEILTYLIVIAAFGIAIYKMYLALPFRKKKSASAGKCGSCATGCALKDLQADPDCPPEEHRSFILNKL